MQTQFLNPSGLSKPTGYTHVVVAQPGKLIYISGQVALNAAGEVVGPSHVEDIPLPSMGAEDFSGYLDHAPGCLMRLGTAATSDEPWP